MGNEIQKRRQIEKNVGKQFAYEVNGDVKVDVEGNRRIKNQRILNVSGTGIEVRNQSSPGRLTNGRVPESALPSL